MSSFSMQEQQVQQQQSQVSGQQQEGPPAPPTPPSPPAPAVPSPDAVDYDGLLGAEAGAKERRQLAAGPGAGEAPCAVISAGIRSWVQRGNAGAVVAEPAALSVSLPGRGSGVQESSPPSQPSAGTAAAAATCARAVR